MAVKPIPEGQQAAVPYLVVKDAAGAIDFYQRAFGATEDVRMVGPDKRVGHAEIKIGKAAIFLADEYPEMGFLSPKTIGPKRSPVGIHIYVEDVDALHKRAVAAGAKSLREPADQFYGDRNSQLEDPSGHLWFFATHKEDVSPAEMKKRMEEAFKAEQK